MLDRPRRCPVATSEDLVVKVGSLHGRKRLERRRSGEPQNRVSLLNLEYPCRSVGELVGALRRVVVEATTPALRTT